MIDIALLMVLFTEVHQPAAEEAAVAHYPLFRMELFGCYRSAPRAAERRRGAAEQVEKKTTKKKTRSVWRKQKKKKIDSG